MLVLVALAGGTSTAVAQEPTREVWADQANAECAAVSPGNRILIDRALSAVEKEKYRAAGNRWNQAWRRALRMQDRIEALARPPEDVERIQQWVDGERRSLAVAIRGGDALAEGKLGRWDRLTERSARIDRQAQQSVRDFPMPRCLTVDD